MKKRLITLLVLNVLYNSTEASSNSEIGKNIAASKIADVLNRAKTDINSKNGSADSIGEVINFQGTDLSEKLYQNGNMTEAAQSKVMDKNFVAGQITNQAFLRGNEFELSHKDSFMDKAKYIQQNPTNYIDWLKSDYTDCETTGGDELIEKNLKICDEFSSIKEEKCNYGRVIEVKAGHKYQCIKERNTYNKHCNRKLKLKCNNTILKNITLSNIASIEEYKLDNKNYYPQEPTMSGSNLNMGKHYYFSYLLEGSYYTSVKINISNIEDLVSFKLNKVFIDDHLLIRINNKEAYKTPSYLSGDIGFRYLTPNFELRPYLVKGENLIEVIAVVYGRGSYGVQFEAFGGNCLEWEETWEEQC